MIQKRSYSSKNKPVVPPLSRKSSSAPDRSYPTTVDKLISLQQTIGNQQLQRLLALYQPLPLLSSIHSQRLIQRKPNPVAPVKVEKALRLNKFISDLNTALKVVTGVTAALKIGDFSFFKPEDFVQHPLVIGESEYYEAENDAKDFCAASRTEVEKRCKAAYPSNTAKCIKGFIAEQRAHCKRGIPDKVMIGRYINLRGLTSSSINTSLILFDHQKAKILEAVVHEGIHRLRGNNWTKRSKSRVRFYYQQNILPPISRALDDGTVQIFTELVIAELQKKQWLIGYKSSSYPKEIQYVKGLLQQKGKTLDFLKKAYFTDHSDQDVESLQYWASQNPYK
jgi:hypothetical protein